MKKVFKISSFAVVSLIVMMVGAYMLYPQLHEDAHQEVLALHTTSEPSFHGDRQYIGQEFEDLITQIEDLRDNERFLNGVVDSLDGVNAELQARIEELEDRLDGRVDEGGQEVPGQSELFAGSAEAEEGMMAEEFAERVKSLLNLDEEELAPIVNQMSDEQLIRLYGGGGSLQQEKLLRSLEPDRAAALMSEIML